MIRSFRNMALQRLWVSRRDLDKKTPATLAILDALDVVDTASSPQDCAFIGFRFDEWSEGKQQRFGISITDHWLLSYGWSDGHAIDVDLERIE